MFDWWVASCWDLNKVFFGSWVIWVIGSIVLHELGHGIAAIKQGDSTPIDTGHMTWNPLVHMGAVSLACFALFGFTWGMMPVDPSRFRGRHGGAMVAAAGPAVNLGLAVVCVLGDAAWLRVGMTTGLAPHVVGNIHTFLWTGAMINVMGMLFNMLPVPPLDGSRILADFVPAFDRAMRSEKGAIAGLLIAALLFSRGGQYVWGFAHLVANSSIRSLTAAIGGVWMNPIYPVP